MGHYTFDVRSGSWTGSEMLDEIFGNRPTYKRDVKGWLDIVHPEFRDDMSAYLQTHVLKRQKLLQREYRIVRKSDNAQRWVHGRGNLEIDSEGHLSRMFRYDPGRDSSKNGRRGSQRAAKRSTKRPVLTIPLISSTRRI